MPSKFIVLVLLMCSINILAQQPTQNIRRIVLDEASNAPLAYATVGLANTSFGNLTDSLGHFLLKDVPTGRYDVYVTYLGYEPVVLKEIEVTSAKEILLNIQMKENVNKLDEVVIKSKINKEQPLNTMATVSARMLSVEEARRYAGGFDDPDPFGFGFCRCVKQFW